MSQYTSYYLYQKYEKIGDQDWTPCYPNVYSVSGDNITTYPLVVKSSADTSCGYQASRPFPYVSYRTISGTPYCTGYDKYVDVYYQESYDDGLTWETTLTTTNLVEANSEDCGYVPPTPQYRTISGTPYCTGYDKYVDVYDQVSYDEGSSWQTTATTPTLVEANSRDCGYVPPTPPSLSGQYLTFVAEEDGTFKFSGNSINYSLDSGSTWTTLASNTDSPTVQSGHTIMWKANLTTTNVGIGRFSSSGNFAVKGNPMSLLYEDNFIGKTDLTGYDFAFNHMFYNCRLLTSIEELVLPATTLAYDCYGGMFSFCSSLTTIPSGLLSAATTLAPSCYGGMFQSCTSLTTAPELPATTLAEHCYNSMFNGCTSLETAPTLSAETLVDSCYKYMFVKCNNLNNIVCLATNIRAFNCTYWWVSGVAASGTFTKAASMTSWTSGDNGIPSGWTITNYSN